MAPNAAVAIVLLVVLQIVAIYDSVALMFFGREHTVSFVLASWSSHFPIIPIVVGMLIGHLFWPVAPSLPASPKESLTNGYVRPVSEAPRQTAQQKPPSTDVSTP